MTAPRSFAALALALAVSTACGGEADPGGSGTPGEAGGAFPITIRPANGPVEIPERPERIVSLSATSTEILFAIGAGEQVVAVDETSNYPPEAPVTDLSGLDPNVEALIEFDPDLVVMSEDPGEVVASLEELEVPPVVHPAATTFADSYEQIEQLGLATGHADEAAALVASMRSRIEEIAGSAPPAADGLTYYHELDDTFFTVTSDTFIGHVYGTLGLSNIADRAKGASSGYPQLSAEYIVDANPDLVFLADTKCCGISAESISERPGWDAIAAVRNGDVVPLDDDVASRWGPRIVEFLEAVAAAVNAHLEVAA
jgi:iron complex transport system substrate-binding protein